MAAGNGMLQIGEVARQTALSVDTIRYYEKESLLPKLPRTEGRFRQYTAEDVQRLRFIQQMQGLGFSLREVRTLLDLRSRRQDACHHVRDLLKIKLAQVRSKRRELAALESELSADLRKCDRELKHRQRHAARSCPVLEDLRNCKC